MSDLSGTPDTKTILTISEIWRYPVKSMGGERIAQATLGEKGIPYDRGWAIRDERVKAIRSARYIPRLLMCSARYLPGTCAGLVPHVEITLPDGETVNSDDSAVNQKLSDALGREVTLWSLNEASSPEHLRVGKEALVTGSMESEMRLLFGLEDGEPLPDLSSFSPQMMREMAERATPLGTYFDAYPISVITTSSIRHLQSFVPDVDLDTRRFRANLVVDDGGAMDGLRESGWIGRQLRIGGATLNVHMDVPRCTIVAAAQPGLARHPEITRTLVRNLRHCIAVYCTVGNEGTVATADQVTII